MKSARRYHLSEDLLQPALLDRLTDHAPLKRTESMEEQSISKAQLRQYVLRDLGWLLNSINADQDGVFNAYPEVADSVLNFGVPAFSGNRLSDLRWQDIESAIRSAILRFEPRLLTNTLSVKLITDKDLLGQHNNLHFEIHAHIWSEPYPLEVLLQSSLDLETGLIQIEERNKA